MERPEPRITSVMGVARALLATVSPYESVEVMVAEFGWDVSFQALALLRGDGADEAFALAWQHLLTGPVARDMRELRWQMRTWQQD